MHWRLTHSLSDELHYYSRIPLARPSGHHHNLFQEEPSARSLHQNVYHTNLENTYPSGTSTPGILDAVHKIKIKISVHSQSHSMSNQEYCALCHVWRKIPRLPFTTVTNHSLRCIRLTARASQLVIYWHSWQQWESSYTLRGQGNTLLQLQITHDKPLTHMPLETNVSIIQQISFQ